MGFLWLTVSIALGFWWTVMGLRQANLVAELKKELGGQEAEESRFVLKRQSRMIILEGGFFMFLLVTGGITLIFLSYKDVERSKMLKNFFAALTHEMKTPLASLRLHAETLEEDLKSKKHKTAVHRIIEDTNRLELQMEKALHFAALSQKEILFLEKLNLKEELDKIHYYYQDFLEIENHSDCFVRADRRAIETVLSNIIENSRKHGRANLVTINYASTENSFAVIELSDNGIGFQGEKENIGNPFYRHSSASGSGIGLFLVKTLMQKMNGRAEFLDNPGGFRVKIFIPLWREV